MPQNSTCSGSPGPGSTSGMVRFAAAARSAGLGRADPGRGAFIVTPRNRREPLGYARAGRRSGLPPRVQPAPGGREVPFLDQLFYVGPLVSSLGGADISWIMGF